MVKRPAVLAVLSTLWFVTQLKAVDKPTGDAADSAAMFAQLDGNQDGQLTSDEIPEDKKRLFARLLRLSDKNGDGKLSRDEFAAAIQRKSQRRETAGEEPDKIQRRPGPEGRPAPEKMFGRLDANGDGKITLDEVPEPRQEMFKAILKRGDKDGDGALNQEEFVQGLRDAFVGKPGAGKRPDGAPDPARLFRRIDKNGDGKLTLDEVPEDRRLMFERMFQRAGKAIDQGLTLEEFAAIMRRGRRSPQSSPRPDGPRAGVPPRGGLFLALDTDHDGKLSTAEISAASDTLKKLDKNGDGTITLDELIASAN